MKQKLINLIQGVLFRSTGFKLIKVASPKESIDCYTTVQNLLRHHQPVNVCDIGSNNGSWFETLLNYGKNINSVVLIEPQQKYQQTLKRFSDRGIDAKLFKYGISDKKDTLKIKGGNACASFLEFDNSMKEVFTGSLIEESEEVPVTTLDELYSTNNLNLPDLVKIDVQGLEKEVIQGGRKILSTAHMVVVELSTHEFYKGQRPMWEIIKLLEESGFYLADIGYIWREEYHSQKQILQLDGIFMKR